MKLTSLLVAATLALAAPTIAFANEKVSPEAGASSESLVTLQGLPNAYLKDIALDEITGMGLDVLAYVPADLSIAQSHIPANAPVGIETDKGKYFVYRK